MNKFLILLILIFARDAIANKNTEEVYVNSKNIFHDKELDIIYLGEDSLVDYQGTSIKTNRGKIDIKNKKINIDGNFYLNYSGDIMKGNFLKADLEFNEGSAKNVNYIFDKNLKINAKTVDKTQNEIIFRNSFLTTCKIDGFFNCPTWSLKVKKTKYDIEDDFYQHFSTFVQVADKKIFYLPYFSHYGSKAPRKRGFLTPIPQFVNSNYGGNITAPYYIPLTPETDIKIIPKFYYQKGFTKYFENKIEYRQKISEGDLKIFLNNFYDRRIVGKVNKGYTFGTAASLNLSKNSNINVNLNYTSNVSKYKSSNDSKSTSLDSNITLNNYNLINTNDLMVTRISGSKALDANSNATNPYELPSIRYMNYINLKNNIILNNDLNVNLISRDASSDYLPMKIFRTDILSQIQKNYFLKKRYNLINKIIINNSSLSAEEGNKLTNVISGNSNQTAIYISTEVNKIINFKNNYKLKPRSKIIISGLSNTKELNVNDNSQSLSFNYNNLFQENKYFGSDKKEEGSRLVLALEQKINIKNGLNLGVNYGRIYNFEKNKNLMIDINQNSQLSDHLTELSLSFSNNKFRYNSRHDKRNFELKEDSLSYILINGDNMIKLNKNLTSSKSFTNSNSSHFMTTEYRRKINKNSNFTYKTEINLEDEYKIYTQEYKLEFKDECSKIFLLYSINKYNDGILLTPNKTFTINYQIDFGNGIN
jgi:LPS-assembly protein